MKPRILTRKFYGETMQTSLQQMHYGWQQMNEVLDRQGYSGRRVLGYKLPEWQRQQKWTTAQCQRFIESIWLGVGIGTFMVNESFTNRVIDQILLDGQQRLRAIELYWQDDFRIIGEDEQGYFWSELTEEERAQFLRIPFPWIRSQYNDEALAREAYNRHNFGGTPHEESERA